MTTALQQLKTTSRADLLRVYSGKRGCMCGCNGKYYADRAIKDQYNTVNPRQVTRVLNQLEQYGDDLQVTVYEDQLIFHVDDKFRDHYARNYVAYFKR